MKSSIRPSTPADAPAIVALFAERAMRMNVDPQYLVWKYWQPRGDWPGPRSFVMSRGGELIAHAAIMPGTFAWGARRVAMLQMIDWAARAGSGAGVTLLKHLGRTTEALLSIGGRAETRSILPHIGFRTADPATAYARPLFPLRLLRLGVTWRLPSRLARAALRRTALDAPDGDWRTRRLADAGVSQISAAFPRPADGMAVTERTVGLFSYMLSCPTVPMQLHAVERAGRIRGYFLLAPVPGQVRIADCWMGSSEPADWRALILCAVEQAQHDPQAAEVVSWASDPLLAGVLRSCGFHARFQSPVLVRPTAHDAMPEGTLRVQMVDVDDAFLYEGRYEYWG